MTSAPSGKIAIGFSTHTGWAQAVAIAGPLSSPKLLKRGRVDLGVGDDSVHVFHVAAEMTPAEAKGHVERCAKRAIASARAEMTSMLKALSPAKIAPVIGVVVGNAALSSSLGAILKSHMMIHSAEGVFYRRAILQAAEAQKLRSVAVPSRELPALASVVLKVPAEGLAQWLTAFGRTVGRPWGRDEKDAFLAACVAIAAAG